MSDIGDRGRPHDTGSRGARVAALLVVLVVALGLLAWWSGAIGARVDVRQRSHEFFDETAQGEVVTHVHNLGLVPIDVRAVYLQAERGWVRELSPDRLRLGPRESGELVVIYRVDCDVWDSSQPLEPIAVEAGPSVGWTVRTAISLDDAAAWCDEGPRGARGTDD